jgi:serine phosphatase RsbU (regulator of sigma subunit)
MWDGETHTITFAGANMPMVSCCGGEIRTVKGNHRSLGYRTAGKDKPFVDQVFPVEPQTCVYLFTDGMTDHVGGSPPRLFGRRRLTEVIAAIQALPLPEQVDRIQEALSDHRDGQHRRDDMTIIAFKPY